MAKRLKNSPPVQDTVVHALDRAVTCMSHAWLTTSLSHLPMPVQFRAAGALQAWEDALRLGEGGQAILQALRNPEHDLFTLRNAIVDFTWRHAGAPPAQHVQLVRFLTAEAAMWLAYWWRPSALYEPTPALSTMLDASDITHDLPVRLLRLPAPALCVVPPPTHRAQCAGAVAVMVFAHSLPTKEQPQQACLTIQALSMIYEEDGPTLDAPLLRLIVQEGDRPLAEVLDRATESAGPHSGEKLSEAQRAHLNQRWRVMLGYVAKILLYASLDRAVLIQERPHTLAPRQMPGVWGKKKREQHRAQINQLYDRYIVGPAVLLDQAAAAHGAQNGHGRSITTPHWRRGHFRMHAYGPRQALRKLMFIEPTLVKADLLDDLL